MPAERARTRVFLLFDSTIIRQWVACQLRRFPDIRICGEADGPLTAISEIKRLRPDAVILHAHDYGRFGIKTLGGIRNISPGTMIIALSSGILENGRSIEAAADVDVLLPRFADWRKVPRILRELRPAAGSIIQSGPLYIDTTDVCREGYQAS